MIELPESIVLAKQINNTLAGKTITDVQVDASPHKFAWYSFKGSTEKYKEMLVGKQVDYAKSGVEIYCGDAVLIITTPIKYHGAGDKLPDKHQLLLSFDDGSHMSCTVQMWGCMFCYPKDKLQFPDGYKTTEKPDPLDDTFTKDYFEKMIAAEKPNLSVKGLLATGQRMPGLGNGALQDILFNAGVNPKRKIETLSDEDKDNLYNSIKLTLQEMTGKGGRDTERDLYGKPGRYRTILSAKTINSPCRNCGGNIKREAYMGGNIYYCPGCQKD